MRCQHFFSAIAAVTLVLLTANESWADEGRTSQRVGAASARYNYDNYGYDNYDQRGRSRYYSNSTSSYFDPYRRNFYPYSYSYGNYSYGSPYRTRYYGYPYSSYYYNPYTGRFAWD
jgi:hypothetical protein